jgi:hypothetical protein
MLNFEVRKGREEKKEPQRRNETGKREKSTVRNFQEYKEGGETGNKRI